MMVTDSTSTLFDIQYDNSQVSLFGTPIVAGNNNIIFQPNNFYAESAANKTQTTTSTFVLKIIPKGLSQVSSLNLFELGDFTLKQSGSSVNVGGQLIAYDPLNLPLSYTTNTLTMLTPANTGNTVTLTAPQNVQNANWSAQTALTAADAALAFAGAGGFYVELQNQLQAFAPPNDPNSYAFVQKKVTGNAVTLTVMTTPIPAAGLLLAGGLAGLFGFGARRPRALAATG